MTKSLKGRRDGRLRVGKFALGPLLLFLLDVSCVRTQAAEGEKVDAAIPELPQWRRSLRDAGGTPQEVDEFEAFLSRLPNASLLGWRESIRNAPPSFFFEHLAGGRYWKREAARETVPKAIFPEATPVRTCASLRDLTLENTTIDRADIDATDHSCRVTAIVVRPPANNPIRIFIALPVEGWNGRFNGTGGGGYSGGSTDSLDARVAKGYAVAATDTGNETGAAVFALDPSGKQAWHRLRDNAYLGIHEMTVVAKVVTHAFYGKAPRYAYFIGGSTGGRQALTEAQRYPEDYSGILAMCPAIARDRYVPAQLWPQVLMREAGNFLSREKTRVATLAAIQACDDADGVSDGIVDDPTTCRFDPAALIGTKVDGGVFTQADADVIRAIWQGPRGYGGRFLWWGPTPGTDLSVTVNTVGQPLQGAPSNEGLDWFRYFVTLDPNWDWRTLSKQGFELLFEQSIQTHSSAYGGDDVDLTKFADRGGKLLIVHGLADQFVPPQASIAYYQNVQRRFGDKERMDAFFRMFMAPGIDHRFIGSGPSPTRMIDALVSWVENGKAPDRLLAESLPGKGAKQRTRPLFPYPKVARYHGKGNIDVAENFVATYQISP